MGQLDVARRLIVTGSVSLLLLLSTWGVVLADDAADLIGELMCPSDCVETLAVCQMTEAVQMRAFVKTKVAEGWSKDRITDTLVAQYGERILAAPTKQGFNLTAWITPFAAILGGGAFISLLIGTWVKRRRVYDGLVQERVSERGPEELDAYRQRLRAELQSFD